jgi:predicted outer membrane repeat protein
MTKVTPTPAPPPTPSIDSWGALMSAAAAAEGKVVTLTLATPFSMKYSEGVNPTIRLGAQTSITIVGNGAIFDAKKFDPFTQSQLFSVSANATLAMSYVTVRNGWAPAAPGGGIYSDGTLVMKNCEFDGNTADDESGGAVAGSGTATFTDCFFLANSAGGYGPGRGGAILFGSGVITLVNCGFCQNKANPGGDYPGPHGGALFFGGGTTALLKNCSFAPLSVVSYDMNDVARSDNTAKVTFACADGETGAPVNMWDGEYNITVIPPKELQCN